MATIIALKKKIAALEAKVELVQKTEMQGAIAKIRKIMQDFGVTLEHLSANEVASSVSSPGKSTQQVTVASATRRSKAPKYRDPISGVTWAGVGRAPAWIVGAANRDDFLIANAGQALDSDRQVASGGSASSDEAATTSHRRAAVKSPNKKELSPVKAVKGAAAVSPAKSARTKSKQVIKPAAKKRGGAAGSRAKSSSNRSEARNASKGAA